MGRSTAALGRDLGLNSQEMNILLRDKGYLEGEPGDWKLTDKGREHAKQQHWDVPSSGHAGYVTTRWDDSVREDIGEVSPECKRQIDDEISARRAEQHRQRQERQTALDNNGDDDSEDGYSYDRYGEDAVIDGKAAGVAIAVLAIGFLGAKFAKWAKPRVEKWWDETAQPKLSVTKEKLAARFKKAADSQQEEMASGSPKAEESRNKGEKDEGEKN